RDPALARGRVRARGARVDARRHGDPRRRLRGLRVGRGRYHAGAGGGARRLGAPAGPGPGVGSGVSLSMPSGFARMSPTLVALGLILITGAAWLVVRLFASRWPVRVSATWG